MAESNIEKSPGFKQSVIIDATNRITRFATKSITLDVLKTTMSTPQMNVRKSVLNTIQSIAQSHIATNKSQKEVQKLRDHLPKLTKDEIRRFRVPYHKALLAELEEGGYVNSADFLAQLFQYQEDYRNEHSYDVIILARAVLIECNDILDHLYDGLKSAESAHFEGDIATEIDELLSIAHTYGFDVVDWWWLAEQFFAQALRISEHYNEDNKFRQTLTYYLYGKYLIEQTKIIHLGMRYLNIARVASADKEWSPSNITGKSEKYLFVEVCAVLYHTLISQARKMLKYNPHAALEICLEARQRGVDACLPRADIFFLQGQCEMESKQANKAIGSFMKAFLLYKTNKQLEESCEAMMFLAQAYQDLGKLAQTQEQLQKMLAFAEKERLPKYIGMAYLSMGQYFLNQGTPELASPYLSKALDIFHEINDVPHREFVKNLEAVSKGQETFGTYVKLILRCGDKDLLKRRRNLSRLLKWKDDRTPFWDDMTESITEFSYEGVEEEEEDFDIDEMESEYVNVGESVGEEDSTNELSSHQLNPKDD